MTPALLDERAVAGVRLLLLDVDGVMTDGRLWFSDADSPAKAFHVRDGLGIALLHRAGLETGIVSGRAEDNVRRRAEELKMSVIALGIEDKGEFVRRLLAERGLPKDAVAYVGDDVNDVPALRAVGVSIAVADAHPDVLPHVRFVTRNVGGNCVVREIADLMLRARSPGSPTVRAGGSA